mmetsp:Transcript_4011/g.16750  ORF Transcript_4011/g.16750 Transcript_4011/m.16750 type:complete len:502 (-) Transcript_4011:190-1695(-)
MARRIVVSARSASAFLRRPRCAWVSQMSAPMTKQRAIAVLKLSSAVALKAASTMARWEGLRGSSPVGHTEPGGGRGWLRSTKPPLATEAQAGQSAPWLMPEGPSEGSTTITITADTTNAAIEKRAPKLLPLLYWLHGRRRAEQRSTQSWQLPAAARRRASGCPGPQPNTQSSAADVALASCCPSPGASPRRPVMSSLRVGCDCWASAARCASQSRSSAQPKRTRMKPAHNDSTSTNSPLAFGWLLFVWPKTTANRWHSRAPLAPAVARTSRRENRRVSSPDPGSSGKAVHIRRPYVTSERWSTDITVMLKNGSEQPALRDMRPSEVPVNTVPSCAASASPNPSRIPACLRRDGPSDRHVAAKCPNPSISAVAMQAEPSQAASVWSATSMAAASSCVATGAETFPCRPDASHASAAASMDPLVAKYLRASSGKTLATPEARPSTTSAAKPRLPPQQRPHPRAGSLGPPPWKLATALGQDGSTRDMGPDAAESGAELGALGDT